MDNDELPTNVLDRAINQIHDGGTGVTDEAYWAFYSFARSLCERLPDEEVEAALVETIAEDVASSIHISYDDVPQELVKRHVDLPDNAKWERVEPTPALVRVALSEEADAGEQLADLRILPANLPDVRVRLSSAMAGTDKAVA